MAVTMLGRASAALQMNHSGGGCDGASKRAAHLSRAGAYARIIQEVTSSVQAAVKLSMVSTSMPLGAMS